MTKVKLSPYQLKVMQDAGMTEEEIEAYKSQAGFAAADVAMELEGAGGPTANFKIGDIPIRNYQPGEAPLSLGGYFQKPYDFSKHGDEAGELEQQLMDYGVISPLREAMEREQVSRTGHIALVRPQGDRLSRTTASHEGRHAGAHKLRESIMARRWKGEELETEMFENINGFLSDVGNKWSSRVREQFNSMYDLWWAGHGLTKEQAAKDEGLRNTVLGALSHTAWFENYERTMKVKEVYQRLSDNALYMAGTEAAVDVYQTFEGQLLSGEMSMNSPEVQEAYEKAKKFYYKEGLKRLENLKVVLEKEGAFE